MFFNDFKCCEPTYEELKQYKTIPPKPPNFCCEPTYEELKPFSSSFDNLFSTRCEPTYEELKLNPITIKTPSSNKVASLPMRN